MSSTIQETASKSFEPVEAKKICETNPEDAKVDTRKPLAPVYNPNEVTESLVSYNEYIEERPYDDSDDDSVNTEAVLRYLKEKLYEPSNSQYSATNQDDNLEKLEKLNSLNLTFHKVKRLNQLEVFNIVNQIKGEPQNIKFVRLSFQECWRMKDNDLENIGKAIGAKLGNVEYLNLSLYKLLKTTIFGIHQLISGIAGQGNTIKVLRLRIREDWNIGNQSLKELIRMIRASLVNLEELKIVISGNLWVTNGGIKDINDDERKIEGLGLGLKKYEVIHYWWSMVGLVKDASTKDMSEHIMEKLDEMGVKEGMLVDNKMFVWYKWVAFSKVVNKKIVLGATAKSTKA